MPAAGTVWLNFEEATSSSTMMAPAIPHLGLMSLNEGVD